jgi:hypothetical protein
VGIKPADLVSLALGRMVGLGRVELPTRGLGKHRAVLNGFENFPFYVIRQPLNELAF